MTLRGQIGVGRVMELTGHSAGGATVQDQNEWEQDDTSRKERHREDRSLTVAESGVASKMVGREEVAVSASGSLTCRYCVPSMTRMGLFPSLGAMAGKEGRRAGVS